MKVIIESRCRLCGTKTKDEFDAPDQKYAESVMARRSNVFYMHDCGTGRVGVVEVLGMYTPDSTVSNVVRNTEKESFHGR